VSRVRGFARIDLVLPERSENDTRYLLLLLILILNVNVDVLHLQVDKHLGTFLLSRLPRRILASTDL
jgi:hypothetical protein